MKKNATMKVTIPRIRYVGLDSDAAIVAARINFLTRHQFGVEVEACCSEFICQIRAMSVIDPAPSSRLR